MNEFLELSDINGSTLLLKASSLDCIRDAESNMPELFLNSGHRFYVTSESDAKVIATIAGQQAVAESGEWNLSQDQSTRVCGSP